MLPLQQNKEKSFEISFDPCPQIILEDLIQSSHAPIAIKHLEKRSRKDVLNISDYLQKNSNENHKIKLIHREMEKQRREQMRSLYVSLRSLLPIEYIKGKRAISDHIHEAVNYINHLKKRVEIKEAKRDELSKFYNNSNYISHNGKSDDHSCVGSSISIHPSNSGVHIMVASGSNRLSLSRVMKVLFEEEIDVVNSVSTKVDEKLLHSIQVEVSDKAIMDLPRLQQMLTEAVTSSKRIFK